MFSCNLPPALLAEWPEFFTCYCGNTYGGGTDTEIRVSTESRPWRRKFSRRSSREGFEPATFQSRVRCSNHWAIPAPMDGESRTATSTFTQLELGVRRAVCSMFISAKSGITKCTLPPLSLHHIVRGLHALTPGVITHYSYPRQIRANPFHACRYAGITFFVN